MFHSNTRRRISLQALVHAATFCRRMEKIYSKMDPLQPSPSEEELLKNIHISTVNQQKHGGQEKPISKQDEQEQSSRWKKAKTQTMGPNSEYGFMMSFTRLFSQLNANSRSKHVISDS